MGKAVNYLREYKEIKEVEKRDENIYVTSFVILLTLAVTFPFYSDVSVVIFAPFFFTAIFFKLSTVKKLKGRARELGFYSVKDFMECVKVTREFLETRGTPDELMNEEQNRIIGDFVKGRKKGEWNNATEMFAGGGISIAHPPKFQLNGIMELALSEDDEEDEDEEINALKSLEAERETCD